MNKIINLKELPNQGQRERRSRARATREEPVTPPGRLIKK